MDLDEKNLKYLGDCYLLLCAIGDRWALVLY